VKRRHRPPNVHPAIWLVSGLKETANGCLEWQRGRTSAGYGQMTWVSGEGTRYTHRLAWEMAKGPIPPGQCVLHSCDNPPCCTPEHLFLGSKAENTADMVEKGRLRVDAAHDAWRSRAACKHGHIYTEATTKWTPGGARVCLVCRRQYDRRRRPPKKVPMPAGAENYG